MSENSIAREKTRLTIWIEILGGIVGVPLILFGLGFLVQKGHDSFLGLPSGLFASSSEKFAFQAFPFLADTFFYLTLPVALLAFVPGLRDVTDFLGKSKPPNTWQIVIWAILLLGAANVIGWFTILRFPLLDSRSANAGADALARFFIVDRSPLQKDVIYLIISTICLISGLVCGHLFRFRQPNPTTRSSMLQWSGFLISALLLLDWPLCYGKLKIPYTYPMVKFSGSGPNSSFQGLILNPQNDSVWSVLVLSPKSDNENQGFRVLELKSAPLFQVVGYEDLFSAVQSK